MARFSAVNFNFACLQVNCGDNDDPGYGKKRKKRSLYSPRSRNGTNGQPDNLFLGKDPHEQVRILSQLQVIFLNLGKTKNWEENLELKIRMPPDIFSRDYSKSASDNSSLRVESECKIYLIVTLSVALTFCVLSATIVVVACFKKYQETKAISMAQSLEKEEMEQMARTEVKSVKQQPLTTHFQAPQYNHGSVSSNRPVTVRSVKRRDKAKIEERRAQNIHVGKSMQQNIPNQNQRSLVDDRSAVMV